MNSNSLPNFALRAMQQDAVCYKALDLELSGFNSFTLAVDTMKQTVRLASEMYPGRPLSLAVWSFKEQKYKAIFSTEMENVRYFH